MDFAAIRNAIAERLANIEGLRVRPYMLGTVDPPVAMIRPGAPIVWSDNNNGGMDAGEFRVLLLVSNADDPIGQAKLDTFLATTGPQSVKAAIEGDRHLGGTVNRCRVTGFDAYGLIEWGSTTYLGADLGVGIVTSPD